MYAEDKSNTQTRGAQAAPHHQRQRQHHHRHHREVQLLREAEEAAQLLAYVAEGLAVKARQLPSARNARVATDGLALAVHAHCLAELLFTELESAGWAA